MIKYLRGINIKLIMSKEQYNFGEDYFEERGIVIQSTVEEFVEMKVSIFLFIVFIYLFQIFIFYKGERISVFSFLVKKDRVDILVDCIIYENGLLDFLGI